MLTRIMHISLVVGVLGISSACRTSIPPPYKPPPLTAAEMAELQTRVFDTDFDTAFGAVVSVLQENAWDIQDIGKDTGVIQALSRRIEAEMGPEDDWLALPKEARRHASDIANKWTRWEKITVHVEPWGSGRSRVRISVTKFGTLPAVTYRYKDENRRDVMVAAPAHEEQVIVDDPLVYGLLFGKIAKAVELRNRLQADK